MFRKIKGFIIGLILKLRKLTESEIETTKENILNGFKKLFDKGK